MLRVSDLAVKQGAFRLFINELVITEPGLILLLGPNGSGKTTFFKSISGFLKYRGSILYNVVEIREMSFRARARQIAYLPQFISLNSMIVRDFLVMGRFPYIDLFSGYSAEDWKKVDEAVDMFSLGEYVNRDISTLSQGELQRVYLAKVFIQDARVLLLDEPTSVLDIGQKKRTAELVQKYLGLKKGSVAMIATHEPSVFTDYANSVIFLKNGTVRDFGPLISVYKKEAVEKLFILE
ncbi:MAG: ABC transporter ATP-binding protein [Oligoflexia bacterium]|nr:ABC transporter ATP-binding protein [Oligoflexia bacterium]